jgi:ABC-type multidrug transport system fused ATPase/permease subunit
MEPNIYRYIIRRSLKLQLVLIAISFILGLVLTPWMLRLTKQIIDAAIKKGDVDALYWLCAAFLGAVLANGALKYFKQNLEGYICETMLRNLRSDLHARILRFPLPHFRNTSTGQLVAMIIGEVEDLGNFFGEALSTPTFHGAVLAGTIGYMVFTNPYMALMGVVLFPVQVWVVRKLQRRVTQLSRERVRMVRGLSDKIQEAVGGIQEIYANDTTAYEAASYRGLLQRIFEIRFKIYNFKYLAKWINNFMEKFGQFLLLLVGGWLAITRPDAFSVGALVTFLQAYSQLNEPWRELINYFQQKENARIKYEQVIVNFDVPGLRPEFSVEETRPAGAELQGAYDLRGTSVILDGTTRALERIQLGTQPGQHVALVGAAGSGRSTLALVLAKLYAYSGTALLDGVELAQVPGAVAGRQIGWVGSEARIFTGTMLDNLVYGLRHRPAAAAAAGDASRAAPDLPEPDEWLDAAPLGVADRAGVIAAVLDAVRLVALDGDLYALGLRATIDPERQPGIAERLLTARRLVTERFAQERGEPAVEFFDRERFADYASVGENILFGSSPAPGLAPDRLAEHEHFRRVIAEVGLRGQLLGLGAELTREMVEIFKDIPADHELFTNFSLIAASELPEYVRLVGRLERAEPGALAPEDQQHLIQLSLRLIPARHRLGRIDDDAEFRERVVAARRRFAETLPPDLAATFAPYDRTRYFAGGTILENLLFGKVVATSSAGVKKVNTVVEEVINGHGLREVVIGTGLDFHVGLGGSRLSPVQRQRVALARALLKRPHILILDEAVAALEADKRAEMHERITEAMKGRTVVAVVDRIDLARYYERVVVLEGGKVADTGTYTELLAREGLFRDLATQAGLAPP